MTARYKLLVLISILLVVGACAAGGGGGGPSAGPRLPGGETLAQGERPRQTENTRTAQRHLERAQDAEDPVEAQTQYQLALEAAELAIAEDDTNPLGYRQAAFAAVGLEDYEAAGAHFDRASELRPIYHFEDRSVREELWLSLYQEAGPFLEAGDYRGAARIFEDAHAVYKERPEVMFTLAQIYGQLRETDLALERIDETLTFAQSDNYMEADSATQTQWRDLLYGLPVLRAQVLTDADRVDEAIEAYRAVVSGDPGNKVATLNLAGLLVENQASEEAFAIYRDLMAGDIELDALDYYRIGVGFYNGDDAEMAREAFGATVRLNPRDRDALEMWTRTLAQDSVWNEVPQAAERWLELDPVSEVAHLFLAQSNNRMGNDAAAVAAVDAIEAMDFDVQQLRIQRYSDGGARVTGSVNNKKLAQGASVNLVFTFYGEDGSAIGEVSTEVSVSAVDQQQVFSVDFASSESVAGYGYRVEG